MIDWQMERAAAVLCASLCLALGACGGGDRAGRDTTALGGDTAAMGGAMTDTGVMGGGMAGAMSDAEIMAHVGGANGAEIAAGELARDKATNADVKEFARTMVRDHQRLQAQADSLAQRLNVTPAASATDSMTRALDDMRTRLRSEAAGAGFDRMYMEGQVQAHENTLNMLNQASAATGTAELRELIQGAIPTVQQHLDRARQVLNGLGASAGG